ncbi:hypothetical protein BG000_011992 [Podila horticola]|nr:hypothetical protein BG000_011992 [Podila horticola]
MTKRGLQASATLPTAKKKRVIADEDDDDNDIEEEPSWLDDDDDNATSMDEKSRRGKPALEIAKTKWLAYNRHFPQSKKAFDQKSMKNKIEGMKVAFKRGHGLAHKSGFGSKGSESGKQMIKEAYFYYFDLEDN